MPAYKPILYLLAGALAATLLATTSALAGSGVGGVFNLGQSNTVNAQTTLTGNAGGTPQLKVVNLGTAAAVRGEAQNGIGTNGISASGVGQQGASESGTGTLGTHSNSTGTKPGVEGITNSTDPNGAGVLGRNTGGGPGLRAIVNAGAPPLAVNSSVKVVNLNADKLDGVDSLGFWKLDGNAVTSPGTNFLGTTDNQALELKVNNQRALRLEPDATSPNVIGGHSGNGPILLNGTLGMTIGGGGTPAKPNHVTDNFGTIGGGRGNRAGDADGDPNGEQFATVAGGTDNRASGGTSTIGGGATNTASGLISNVGGGDANTASGSVSTVGGGENNTASALASVVAGGSLNMATADYSAIAGGHENSAGGNSSVVAGGFSNTANGASSTIGGGVLNTASGEASMVPGGYSDTASGNYSFAGGTQAKATHLGSFVWGDNTFADVVSPAANTFTVRASGGIWLGATSTPSIGADRFIDTSTGGFLTSTGVWTNSSDRALKHDFRTLDKRSVLEKVARMPITSWSYTAEQPGIRHIGPMAQDFYNAFGLALDDKHITTIDEGGVALAAIQGLYRQNKALQRQNRRLASRLAIQNARLNKLERTVASLTR